MCSGAIPHLCNGQFAGYVIFLWVTLSPYTWTPRCSPLASESGNKDGQSVPNTQDPDQFGRSRANVFLPHRQYSLSGAHHWMSVLTSQNPVRWEKLDKGWGFGSIPDLQGTPIIGSSGQLSCRIFDPEILGSHWARQIFPIIELLRSQTLGVELGYPVQVEGASGSNVLASYGESLKGFWEGLLKGVGDTGNWMSCSPSCRCSL